MTTKHKSNAGFYVDEEELHACRNNRGILAAAPEQWNKEKLHEYISDLIHKDDSGDFRFHSDSLEKESLLTFAGQLQRYGGEYYMGLAKTIRLLLNTKWKLATGPVPIEPIIIDRPVRVTVGYKGPR